MPLMPLALIGCVMLLCKVANGSAKKFKKILKDKKEKK